MVCFTVCTKTSVDELISNGVTRRCTKNNYVTVDQRLWNFAIVTVVFFILNLSFYLSDYRINNREDYGSRIRNDYR